MQNTIHNSELIANPDASLSPSELVNNYLRLVKSVGIKLCEHLPPHIQVEDLITDGAIGLMKAASRYKGSMSVRFATYAGYCIKGAMLDYLRGLDELSRAHRHELKELGVDGGAKSQRMTVSYNDYVGHYVHDPNFYTKSYETINAFTHYFPDAAPSPEACAIASQEATKVRRSITALLHSAKNGNRLITLLWLYYWCGINMKQIGRLLGVNESRASQLHQIALKALRESYARNEHNMNVGMKAGMKLDNKTDMKRLIAVIAQANHISTPLRTRTPLHPPIVRSAKAGAGAAGGIAIATRAGGRTSKNGAKLKRAGPINRHSINRPQLLPSPSISLTPISPPQV